MSALLAVVAFIVGILLGRIQRKPEPEGLPCPNLPCTNRLPRRGLWSHSTGDWAVEDCPVCGVSVQYSPVYATPAVVNSADCYIRVQTPRKETT